METVFDELSAALRAPIVGWRKRIGLITVELASNAITGLVVGLGVGLGMALAL